MLQRAARDQCEAWLTSEAGERDAYRRLRPPSEAFWDPQAWDEFLQRARGTPPEADKLVPTIHARVLAQALPEPTAPGWFSVRLALENLREDDNDKECGLFGVSLEVELPDGALGPMRLERVRRSYHLAGFTTMPAIGVNGGVEDLGAQEVTRKLRTTWMPRYCAPADACPPCQRRTENRSKSRPLGLRPCHNGHARRAASPGTPASAWPCQADLSWLA